MTIHTRPGVERWRQQNDHRAEPNQSAHANVDLSSHSFVETGEKLERSQGVPVSAWLAVALAKAAAVMLLVDGCPLPRRGYGGQASRRTLSARGPGPSRPRERFRSSLAQAWDLDFEFSPRETKPCRFDLPSGDFIQCSRRK